LNAALTLVLLAGEANIAGTNPFTGDGINPILAGFAVDRETGFAIGTVLMQLVHSLLYCRKSGSGENVL
jgi:hypothetical protein